VMYEGGQGVAQDYITAHMWFNIASANRGETAAEKRERIGTRMSSAEISEAQRRAKECLASNYTRCDN